MSSLVRLFSVIAGSAITVAANCVGSQSLPRHVEGVVLLSSDSKLKASIHVDLAHPETYEAFGKRFPGDRFVVREWGKRSAVVIDLKSGPLGFLRIRAAAAQAVLQKLGPSRTLGYEDLTKEERTGLYLDGMAVPSGSEGGGALGLCGTVNVDVKHGSSVKTLVLPIKSPTDGARRSDLDRRPIVSTTSKSKAKGEDDVPSGPVDDSNFHFYGVAIGNYSEGLVEASKVAESVEKSLRSQLKETTLALVKLLGLRGSPIPAGDTNWKDLPDSFKNDVLSQFQPMWQQLGFGSESDVAGFFQNCDSLQVSTNIGIMFTLQPGDSRNHVPGTGGVVNFSTVPGGFASGGIGP